MAKSELEEKQERKSVQLNITISPYLREQLQELVDRGMFSNISDAVRHAVHEMIARMETQGKLKPVEEKVIIEKKLKKIDEGEID